MLRLRKTIEHVAPGPIAIEVHHAQAVRIERIGFDFDFELLLADRLIVAGAWEAIAATFEHPSVNPPRHLPGMDLFPD